MKLETTAPANLESLVSSIKSLGGQIDGLQQQINALSSQVQGLNFDMPRPISDFGPRIADGASATSLSGTDPSLGGPLGGADKGGAGHGVKETSLHSGGSGHAK